MRKLFTDKEIDSIEMDRLKESVWQQSTIYIIQGANGILNGKVLRCLKMSR